MPEAEDKEKADKLAAARAAAKKRAAQVKKQSKKKAAEDKTADTEVEEKAATEEAEEPSGTQIPETTEAGESGEQTEATSTSSANKTHTRQPSISVQSKLRSESFRNSAGPLSPGLTSPNEVSKEVAQLKEENEDLKAAREKLEEQLEELRVASADNAGLKEKAQRVDDAEEQIQSLKTDIASLQRQNTQLQSAASRRKSSVTASPSNAESELKAQLESRSRTIEALELEVSKLNAQVKSMTDDSSKQETRIAELESSLAKTEEEAKSKAQELEDFKANLKGSDKAEGSAESLETRLAELRAELGAAQRKADDASKRSETLEKKIEALTSLHRENESRSQGKITELQRHEREAKELRTKVGSLTNDVARLQDEAINRKKAEATGESTELDDFEDDERARLQARVRELEEETYNLRQGAWRDRRRELQMDMDDHNGFDDVDLSASGAVSPNRPSLRQQQQHSSFIDVVNSGISAFTGADNRRQSMAAKARPRGQSLGLLSEDGFEFDEDAFRKAQEDEGRARLERVKAIKKGLPEWAGWRVDLVDLRAPMGGLFDV